MGNPNRSVTPEPLDDTPFDTDLRAELEQLRAARQRLDALIRHYAHVGWVGLGEVRAALAGPTTTRPGG